MICFVFHRFWFNVLDLQWKSVKRGSVGIKPLRIYVGSETRHLNRSPVCKGGSSGSTGSSGSSWLQQSDALTLCDFWM